MDSVTLAHRFDHPHCAPHHSPEATLALLSAAHRSRQACRCSPVSSRAPEFPKSLHHCIPVAPPATLALASVQDSIGASAATVWAATKPSKKRTKACSLWKRKTSSRAHRGSPRSLLSGSCPERANPPLDPLADKEPSKRKLTLIGQTDVYGRIA